jgi:hypothetical protein
VCVCICVIMSQFYPSLSLSLSHTHTQVLKQSRSLQLALFFNLFVKTAVLGSIALFGATHVTALIFCNLFGDVVGKNANAFAKKAQSPLANMLTSLIGMSSGYAVLTMQQLGVIGLSDREVALIFFLYCSLSGYNNGSIYLSVGEVVAHKDVPTAIGLLNVTLMGSVCLGIVYSVVLQELVSM